MIYINLNQPDERVDLKQAILKSLGNASGLYMPSTIPRLPDAFFDKLNTLSLVEIAFEVSKAMFGEDVDEASLFKIVENALTFPIPLKPLSEDLYVLELFHGPTLAFKDVGARFMAGLFEYFVDQSNEEVTILVATSGDTGGAVANAFHHKKGIKVVILYPSGKVSPLQEKQLTTLGGNITALEIEGNFDDCQALVKQAFSDPELNTKLNLTSANSINFARLFPQSFYYFHAYAQLNQLKKPVLISVPSGNFGNLTAGLIAKRMGLPIAQYIAATNANHVVPTYLETGQYEPHPTVYTISNAMDVGQPSNFPRMMHLYEHDLNALQQDVSGFWCDDEENREWLKRIYQNHDYQADPHGAIGYAACVQNKLKDEFISIFIETAHPAKFPESVEEATQSAILLPKELADLVELTGTSIKLSKDYQFFKEFMMKS